MPVTFDTRARRAFTLDEEGRLRVWDLSEGAPRVLADVRFRPAELIAAAGEILVLAGGALFGPARMEALRWPEMRPVGAVDLGTSLLTTLAASSRAGLVVLYGEDERLVVARTDASVQQRLPAGECCTGACFDDEGRRFAVAHTSQGGGHVSVYEVHPGGMRPLHEDLGVRGRSIEDWADTFATLVFDSAGRRLAVHEGTQGPTNAVAMFDVESGEPIWRTDLDVAWAMWNADVPTQVLGGIAFASDEEVLVVAEGGQTLLVLDATEGSVTARSSLSDLHPAHPLARLGDRLWSISAAGEPVLIPVPRAIQQG